MNQVDFSLNLDLNLSLLGVLWVGLVSRLIFLNLLRYGSTLGNNRP